MKRLSILLLSFGIFLAISVGLTDTYATDRDSVSFSLEQLSYSDHFNWMGEEADQLKNSDYLAQTSMKTPTGYQITQGTYRIVVGYLLTVDLRPRGPPGLRNEVSINTNSIVKYKQRVVS